jgi:hypothetical protein
VSIGDAVMRISTTDAIKGVFYYSIATDSTLLLPAEQEPAVPSAVGSYSARISRSVSLN